MRPWIAAMLTVSLSGEAAAGEMVTEVLPAGFRDTAELARVLAPLVPAPGSVSSFQGQLIVKTTPQNLDEVKRVLEQLDKAPANLLVTVRRTLDAEVSRDLAEAAVRARSGSASAGAGSLSPGRGASVAIGGRDAAAGVRVERQITTHRGDDVQTLRVLEGKEAFIHTGESVPVGERAVVVRGAGVSVAEGVRYEEFGTGFYVRPRLAGDTVVLDIIPSRRALRGDGSASVQEASTSVSGTLGRWMEVGSVASQSARTGDRLGASRTVTTRRDDVIYVKVERLD